MPDTTPPPPAPVPDLSDRVARLESESQTHRDHRTRVQTLLGLASAAAAIVVIGAVSVRDITLATSARVQQLEQRADHYDATASRRDADDRSTRDAIVRLQTAMETLQSTVVMRLEAIEQHMQDARAPRPSR